jgi:hypothetical protein
MTKMCNGQVKVANATELDQQDNWNYLHNQSTPHLFPCGFLCSLKLVLRTRFMKNPNFKS